MKKVLYIFAITGMMLASCGDSTTTEGESGDSNNTENHDNGDAAATTSGVNTNVSTDQINNTRTAEAPEGSNSAKQAKILFENNEHHFGQVIEGEKAKHTYKFQNVGNGDLLIINAKASCGCTVPNWTKDPIKPGESGEITVEFNSAGRLGNNTKEITVESNTNPPINKLKFTCEVIKDDTK